MKYGKKISIVITLLSAWAFGLHAQAGTHGAEQNEALKVTVYQLENGLTVYLNEDHSRPEILGAVAVKAGSKYDPADATGLAHYLEHMCFKGTTTMGTTNYEAEKPLLEEITRLYDELAKTTDVEARKKIQEQINSVSVKASEYAIPNEMDRLLNSIGSKGVNAFTSFEMVVYHNSFPPHQVEKWLDLYSHRFEEPVFRMFQSELEVVYEEKNRMSDNFGAMLFETYFESFFKKHPYGTQSTIGKTEHLKNPPLRKMEEYYKTYFVANNMALILTGDFSTEQVMPIIQEKFGDWVSGDVPEYPEYKEEPFNGREVVEKRMTPIKMGIMGYRAVPNGDEDAEKLEVCNYLLNNKTETGLLDALRLDGKLQMAINVPLQMEDHGAQLIILLPKLLGQSLEEAEGEVLAALEKLKNGDFDNKMLQAAKNNLKADFYRNLEDSRLRGLYMVDCFIGGRNWNEFLRYPERVDAITKADVMKVASRYFGKDYLVLQSKMGFPKKDKLEKPGFEPVKPQEGVKSEYAQGFESMGSALPRARFVDFERDVKFYSLKGNDRENLYITQNPMNDLFSVKIHYAVNRTGMPLLGIAADFFNYTGADTFSATHVKKKMSELGCAYRVYLEDGELVVELSGLEENAGEAIEWLNKMMLHPKAEQSKVSLVVSDERANRKLETGDPQSTADLLKNYMTYGENSHYLKRPSKKELKKLKAKQLVDVMQQAMAYPVTIHYVGRKTDIQVRDIFKQYSFSHVPEGAQPQPAMEKPERITYNEPVFYILNRKDARQSHMWFYSDAGSLPLDSVPYAEAFNSYFGGDMSSLVFQEIREFRSLAYSARLYYANTAEKGRNDLLVGYIGCQSDKTTEALNTMMDLLNNMPAKPERMALIRSGLRDEAYSERPFFRDLSEKVDAWRDLGYVTDPNKLYAGKYEQIEFTDIESFYKNRVKGLPVSIAIVGNKDDIPIDELRKKGKVVILKEKKIRKK